MSSPQQPPPPDPQAAQAGLAVLVSLAIAKLWPSLDLLHLRQSLPAFKAAVAQEVQRHAQASATLAARQYRSQRVAAGVGGGFTPVPADPPSVGQIAQSVDWAVQPLWDSAVPLVELVPDAPEETRQVAGSAIADAKARLAAASEKLVLGSGWDTITGSVQRDRKASGYARIPEPGCCHFCALLAARGAIYKSGSFARSSAEKKINKLFPDADRAHDNCRCHLEPVWGVYEPSAQIRQWQAQYKNVAEQIGYGTDGRVSAKDMRRAFRQFHEGRPIDVTPAGRSATGSSSATTKPAGPTRKPGERTQEQIQGELNAVIKHQAAHEHEWTDKQREWISNRISILHKQLEQ